MISNGTFLPREGIENRAHPGYYTLGVGHDVASNDSCNTESEAAK
jgi:hypothetical protein